MALKNHALDEKILQAAQTEFLENGFENASVRKIAARAGITFGAIYTRYATKDALFCALVSPLIERISQAFSQIRSSFYRQTLSLSPDQMAQSMQIESDAIVHLLFDDYERAVLLLCRSTGSSMESYFDGLIQRKIEETILFFQARGIAHPDEPVLRLLISGQFHLYFQIIRGGYDLETARGMMHAAMIYHTGGWLTLLKEAGSK